MNFFIFLWVIFALMDPDSESGSTNLIEYGSGFETQLFIMGKERDNKRAYLTSTFNHLQITSS
jgi:hypothetical protein